MRGLLLQITNVRLKNIMKTKIDKLINSNKLNVNTPQYWDAVYTREIVQKKTIHRIDVERWDFLLKYIKDSDKVLDHGCGVGDFLFYAKNKSKAEFYGADQSKVAIKETQNKNIVAKLDPKNFNMKFDVIISQHVIEHLNNPVSYIQELKTILKDNGTLIIVLPINDNEWHEHQMIWEISDIKDLFNRFDCHVKLSKKNRKYMSKQLEEIIAIIKFKTQTKD